MAAADIGAGDPQTRLGKVKEGIRAHLHVLNLSGLCQGPQWPLNSLSPGLAGEGRCLGIPPLPSCGFQMQPGQGRRLRPEGWLPRPELAFHHFTAILIMCYGAFRNNPTLFSLPRCELTTLILYFTDTDRKSRLRESLPTCQRALFPPRRGARLTVLSS